MRFLKWVRTGAGVFLIIQVLLLISTFLQGFNRFSSTPSELYVALSIKGIVIVFFAVVYFGLNRYIANKEK